MEYDSRILIATVRSDLQDSLQQILHNTAALRIADFSVCKVETFPRNYNGKIDYHTLKLLFAKSKEMP
jgi:acyl-coenzyme A synthetase/AMP-(fatty) acid ligase